MIPCWSRWARSIWENLSQYFVEDWKQHKAGKFWKNQEDDHTLTGRLRSCFRCKQKNKYLKSDGMLVSEILPVIRRIKVIFNYWSRSEGRPSLKNKESDGTVKSRSGDICLFQPSDEVIAIPTDRIAFQYGRPDREDYWNGPGYERKPTTWFMRSMRHDIQGNSTALWNAESVLTVETLNVGLKELFEL